MRNTMVIHSIQLNEFQIAVNRFQTANNNQKSYRRNGWLRTTIFPRNGCRMPTLRNGFVPQPFFIDNDFFRKPFFLETLSQRCENRSSSKKNLIANFACVFLLCL